MKKNKSKILILSLIVLFLTTGCGNKILKDKETNKAVINPSTGQSLITNILCQPENIEQTIEINNEKKTLKELYAANDVDLEKLPKCSNFKINSGKYEGIWNGIFVKPLAFVILSFNNLFKNMGLVHTAGIALIITSIIIRLIAYPLTKKTAMQSEILKEAQPELNRLEKKYEGKTDKEDIMRKNQEMMMIYKKYNINPISGCLFALIQLPLFIAFLEAINRVPALFEDTFLGIQLGTTPQIGLFTNGNFLYLILIILVGVTTYFSFRMNKTTQQEGTNPMKNMTNIMTIMIIVMGVFMTSALCIYWITTNLFTIAQNLIVKRSIKHVSKK